MRSRMLRARLTALVTLAAAVAGSVGFWFSIGVLAVVDATPSAPRVGLLPPLVVLVLLVTLAVLASRWRFLDGARAVPLFAALVFVLPWIPGRIPTAFLIWTGPGVFVVWAAIAAAVLSSAVQIRGASLLGSRGGPERPAPRVKELLSDPWRAPIVAAAIAFALFTSTAAWLRFQVGGDEPHYLVMAQSILYDADLQIENNHRLGQFAAYSPGDLKPDYLRRGVNGQIYSIHAPGLPAIVAPVFALFGHRGVIVFVALVSAIASGLVWRSAWLVTGSAGAAWFGWAATALTVPWFFQAFSVFPDSLGAAAVAFTLLALVDPAVLSRPIALGAVVSALPWMHTRFAPLAAVLGLVIAARYAGGARPAARLGKFFLVPAALAVAWFFFFLVIYGTPNPAAPYGTYTQTKASNVPRGLIGLLFDQQFGVVPNAPVFLVSCAGLVALARRSRRLALELVVVISAYFAFACAFHIWWGGYSTPGRLAVPVMPAFAPGAAAFLAATRSRVMRTFAAIALAVSLAIVVVLLGPEHGSLLHNFRDGTALWLAWATPLADVSRAVPSFFYGTITEFVRDTSVWLAILAAACGGLWWWDRRRPLRQGLAEAAGLLTVCVAIMVAASIVWRQNGVGAASPARGQARLLERSGSASRGIRYAPLALEDPARIARAMMLSSSGRAGSGPLLQVPGLPAGRYVVRVRLNGAMKGDVKVHVGSRALALETWSLETDRASGRELTMELPVDTAAFAIDAGAAARQGIGQVSVGQLERPEVVFHGRRALSATRYGAYRAFFLDTNASMEPSGFWVEGGRRTQVLVDPLPDAGALRVFVRNAPVTNRCVVGRDALDLSPGEERLVETRLGNGGPVIVDFESAGGFRPGQLDRAVRDFRYLGCWIELR